MAFQARLFNIGLDAMAADIVSISLHESDPGGTGANEITGGTYARQTPSWGAASGATVAIDTNNIFEIPGGSTVAYVGLWGDADGPVWNGSIALATVEEFAGDGEYTLTQLAITAANV